MCFGSVNTRMEKWKSRKTKGEIFRALVGYRRPDVLRFDALFRGSTELFLFGQGKRGSVNNQ